MRLYFRYKWPVRAKQFEAGTGYSGAIKLNSFVFTEKKSGGVKLHHHSPQVAHYFDRVATAQKIAINSSVGWERRWLWLLFAMTLLVLPVPILAQSGDTAPVVLTDQQDKYPLGLQLELLADPTGQLTIGDVSSPAYDDQFVPSQEEVPNPGSGIVGAIWARVQVRNQADPATTWRLAVEEARLGYVDLYVRAPDGTGFAQHATRLASLVRSALCLSFRKAP